MNQLGSPSPGTYLLGDEPRHNATGVIRFQRSTHSRHWVHLISMVLVIFENLIVFYQHQILDIERTRYSFLEDGSFLALKLVVISASFWDCCVLFKNIYQARMWTLFSHPNLDYRVTLSISSRLIYIGYWVMQYVSVHGTKWKGSHIVKYLSEVFPIPGFVLALISTIGFEFWYRHESLPSPKLRPNAPSNSPYKFVFSVQNEDFDPNGSQLNHFLDTHIVGNPRFGNPTRDEVFLDVGQDKYQVAARLKLFYDENEIQNILDAGNQNPEAAAVVFRKYIYRAPAQHVIIAQPDTDSLLTSLKFIYLTITIAYICYVVPTFALSHKFGLHHHFQYIHAYFMLTATTTVWIQVVRKLIVSRLTSHWRGSKPRIFIQAEIEEYWMTGGKETWIVSPNGVLLGTIAVLHNDASIFESLRLAFSDIVGRIMGTRIIEQFRSVLCTTALSYKKEYVKWMLINHFGYSDELADMCREGSSATTSSCAPATTGTNITTEVIKSHGYILQISKCGTFLHDYGQDKLMAIDPSSSNENLARVFASDINRRIL